MLYDEDNLEELAEYYLTHDEERERIAMEGRIEVHKHHTYEHRVKKLLEIVSKEDSAKTFGSSRDTRKRIHSIYADYYFYRKRFREAKVEYRSLLKLDKYSSKVNFRLGYICGQLGQDDEAIRYLRKAVDLNKEDIEALNTLGLRYIALGEDEKAVEVLGKSLVIDQNQKVVMDLILNARERIDNRFKKRVSVSDEMVESSLSSIVIATCDKVEHTLKCVESILSFTDIPYELIFVDNGSQDKTLEFLHSIKGAKVISNKENLGITKAWNQGIRASRGDFVLIMNNDLVVTRGWLRGMVECAMSDPGIGIVGPRTNWAVPPQKVDGLVYGDLEKMHDLAAKFRARNRGKYFELNRLVFFCVLIKRKVMDQIGFFDEGFKEVNFEDDDYCNRARLGGYKLVCAGDVLIHRFGGRTILSDPDYKAKSNYNRERYFEKWSKILWSSSLGSRFEEINQFTSKTGHPGLKLRAEDGDWFSTSSSYDPFKEAKRLVEDSNFSNTNLLVILGFGVGYHTLEVLKKLKEETALIIVERDPIIFVKALALMDLTPLYKKENLRFIVGKEPRMVINDIVQSGYFSGRIDVIGDPKITRLYPSYYEALKARYRFYSPRKEWKEHKWQVNYKR